jgi:hypothetical protein
MQIQYPGLWTRLLIVKQNQVSIAFHGKNKGFSFSGIIILVQHIEKLTIAYGDDSNPVRIFDQADLFLPA